MSDDLRSLAADLRKASGTVQRKGGQAIRKAAFDIQAQAQARAPVDTGALRNSIGVDLGGMALTAEIGPSVNYAAYVENGTRYMAPQPYMGPAADSVLPQLEQAITELGGEIL